MKIKRIKAKIIEDSRGKPTIETEIRTDCGRFKASVPSGASCGKYEAKSVAADLALINIERIIEPALKEKTFVDQKELDRTLIQLDGTEDKSKLGANALLAVSMAGCRAAAASKKVPLYQYLADFVVFRGNLHSLPRPCFNILNGGVHARNKLAIQEFMIVPATTSFKNNLAIGKKIYRGLARILKKEFGRNIIMGDEGGFAPPLEKTEAALDFLVQAVKQAGYSDLVMFGLDCAASQFFQQNKYIFEDAEKDSNQLLDFYKKIIAQYPILFLEDPFAEDDYSAWQKIVSETKKIFVVGDDLLTTNKQRMEKAQNACNAVIIKPNQIGTVNQTVEAAKLAKQFGWKTIVSHRSGETKDDFITDLAVGIGADFIKSGAPGPAERMAKYKRLVAIEKEIYEKS